MTDCIFCKIINGDFNTQFVYENEYVVVFRILVAYTELSFYGLFRLGIARITSVNNSSFQNWLLL